MDYKRKVRRVLVMLEYEVGAPDDGEVYDLTELTSEMLGKSPTSASLHLTVRTERTYSQAGPPSESNVSWSGWAGNLHTPSCAHLTDVVNAALPDGERVSDIKNRVKRLRKKADKLEYEAGIAKLQQVAQIRHLHPIARVTSSPLGEIEGVK